ncbi:hypothetical protein LSM04_007341 [Trypanosoma melophagium]|uniref:uncharacterized protein n=1 Tax=Trypanosoma melophagium TaxID=715481 RepID=UPI003519ECB8|nr:hypothetical protein LSM04_007341 [Trypanosoma melophagium]
MPIRKKEEVCGKPTQYNLRTCEYDWKYLPDTHFKLGESPGPRNKNHFMQKPPLRKEGPAKTPPLSPRASPPVEQPAIISSPPVLVEPNPLPPTSFPIIPWSHDNLRRIVEANQLEAQRSYLRRVL